MRLTDEQNAAIVAQLSYELEPSTPLPDWNAVAMETVHLRNRIAALEAQIAAADGIATMLENVLSVMQTPDQRMCCDGRECGCQGSTVYQEAEFYARQELAAYRATKGEPK